MPLRVARGCSIQNLASSTRRPAALLSIFAVTTTFRKSLESLTFVTWPMSTSLYLTKVFPASMPSAFLKTMVMVGPSVKIRWTAIPMATIAATRGMIQTTEKLIFFLGTVVVSGTAKRSMFSLILTSLLVHYWNPRSGGDRIAWRQSWSE